MYHTTSLIGNETLDNKSFLGYLNSDHNYWVFDGYYYFVRFPCVPSSSLAFKWCDKTGQVLVPLRRIDDFLSRLNGATHFTQLDLSKGYWQCIVTQTDREKTAFITPDGLFQFLRLPFGLSNAPATFQRLMDRAIAKYKWITCFIYMGDLLVFSPSFEEHVRHVSEIFQA